ncbi:hypothetical protein FIU83_09190 [Halomonas sp. THAF5a]|nr:hypothetical protein FIU83_09190 [Halomonas sp. THAF5a]
MRRAEANFYSDWVAELRQELDQLGYQVSSRPEEEVVHIYLNLQKRLVEPKPRQVHRSREFQCPAELHQGLSFVECAIRRGDDLSPHLSKLIKRADYDDPLLNHWGIHHLHLGTNIDSDQFVERTGPLLFAMFGSECAYLVNVYSHGTWAMQDMVRILHDNWPESIEAYRLNNVIGLANPVSDQDVKVLRKKNVNTFVEIAPNIVYAPIGGGAASSGISIDVVRQADFIKKRLEELECAVLENIEEIAEKAREKGISLPKKPRFELKEQEGKSYAVEVNTRIGVPL